jgi:DNA-binding NtrC family response regulator
MRARLSRQLAPLDIRIVYAGAAAEIARLNPEDIFEVALVPAILSNTEWWALWGAICLMNCRPSILVYTRNPSFELWTGVLEMGGYDVIVEPFTDEQIQEAILRAAQNFRERLVNNTAQP